jgi:hypothetical protein
MRKGCRNQLKKMRKGGKRVYMRSLPYTFAEIGIASSEQDKVTTNLREKVGSKGMKRGFRTDRDG